MRFPILFLIILYITLASSQQLNYKMADNSFYQQFSKKSAIFAINMYNELSSSDSQNIIFSPFSIQTCIAMARMGATGQTAAEIDSGLGLATNDIATIAQTFHNVLENYEKSNILKIANKIYVMKNYVVQKEFNEVLSKKFFSSAESIDFSQSASAAQNINSWVETKTNHLIKNLISPDLLDGDTRLVLLNAIHFKGQWVHKFPEHATHDDEFFLNEEDTVKVPMMQITERFMHADLPELDASAIEMQYKDSDLSMLVVLPNKRTGLKALEQKLKEVELSEITSKMFTKKVKVKFPKFKAEFSVSLNEALQKLGMSRMFSNSAEFDKMLDSKEELKVSAVVHKAFIEVNEEGTEAAAATGAIVRKKRSLIEDSIRFLAEHPFCYFIYQKWSNPSEEESKVADTHVPLFAGAVRRLSASTIARSADRDEL